MRQVPQGQNFYTLIGSGRVAKHIDFLLSNKGISFNKWSRNNAEQFNTLSISENKCPNERLDKSLNKTTHLLLAISDSSINEYINKYASKYEIIHFSGSFYSDKVIGVHPLMTFNDTLFDESFYDQIPFILDKKITLKSIFPDLSNPTYYIDSVDKSYYHSLCVMSGNFSQLLWMNTINIFKDKLDIPAKAIFPYMQKVFNNLNNNYTRAFTGPISRGDTATINNNLKSLIGTPEYDLYQAFLTYHSRKNKTENSKLKKEL